MKRIIMKLARALLAPASLYPTRMTQETDLRRLVDRLRPRRFYKGLIRLGPPGDGGYLVPDDLDGIEACFSPGVADNSGFERDCADRGMRVFMADYSVDGPAEAHDLFEFRKKYLGVVHDDRYMTLDAWVGSTMERPGGDLLLQIDIEGAEYEVLLGASEALMQRFRIIVAEFHQLHLLGSQPFFRIASLCFEKLLQTHTCVHIHPNNYRSAEIVRGLEIPPFTEFTFLRNDRLSESGYVDSFPHPLDSDNTDNAPLVLPRWWCESSVVS
jgi:hypothetical protein